MHSSIETAPLLEQSDHYLWRYCILKIWRIQVFASECSLGVNLVIAISKWVQILHLCIQLESNRTITYGDIAFLRFGGYEFRLTVNGVVLVIGGYQISYRYADIPIPAYYCIPRMKYVRGILWFSRRYAAASAFHRLRDNLKKNLIGLLPYVICRLI